MTREEAIHYGKDYLKVLTAACCHIEDKHKDSVRMAIKALEQEPKAEEFAKWVASEIFDDMWEYNKDAFAELACRRLAKMGIVRAKGDEWELVESVESEE